MLYSVRGDIFALYVFNYNKTCVKQTLSKRSKIGFQDQLSLHAGQKYCRMLQGEHSAILSTFTKLPFVIKTFVLSIFEWPFYTDFTVCKNLLSFRPFSTDQRINTIDPRSYFYLFDFIEQSRMARRDLALVTTWVSKCAYSWKLAHI